MPWARQVLVNQIFATAGKRRGEGEIYVREIPDGEEADWVARTKSVAEDRGEWRGQGSFCERPPSDM